MKTFDELKDKLEEGKAIMDALAEAEIEKTNPALTQGELDSNQEIIETLNAKFEVLAIEVSEFLFGDAFDCIFSNNEELAEYADKCRDENGNLDIDKFLEGLGSVTEDKVTNDSENGVDSGNSQNADDLLDFDTSPSSFEDSPSQPEDPADRSTEKEDVIRSTLSEGICGGDDAATERTFERLSKAYHGDTSKMEAATNFARNCDPASINASSKEEVLQRKIDYDTAKEKFMETKDKYNFRNSFTVFDRLSYNISAYKAGLPGASGKAVTGGEIAMNIMEAMRTNIFESLLEVGLKKFIDKVAPAQDAKVDFGLDAPQNKDVGNKSGDTKVDSPAPDPVSGGVDGIPAVDKAEPEREPVFRENGSVDPKATKEQVDAAAKEIDKDNPAGGKFCGADMKSAPDMRNDISTWKTGGTVERRSIVVDGKLEHYSLPSMRVADVAGNRYLVDPFGKATPIEIRNPSTRLSLDENGSVYIKDLDRSASRTGSARIESIASVSGKTSVEVKSEMSDKAVASYVKDAEARIESHKGFLEGKISEQKECVEGYKEQIAKLETAIERVNEKIDSLDKDSPDYDKNKAELEAKAKDFEASIEKLGKAVESAESKIEKYEGTVERYEKAIETVDSEAVLQDKLSAVIDAESKSVGRAETPDSNMSAKDIEAVSESLEKATEIEDADKPDVAHEEETGDSRVSATDFREEAVDKEEAEYPATAKDTENDLSGTAESDKESQDIEKGNVSNDEERLTVEKILEEKIETVSANEKEVESLKDDISKLDKEIEGVKEKLEANIEARNEFEKQGVDMGEGVKEALDASVEENQKDLDKLQEERDSLEGKIETLEAETEAANDVISFIQDGDAREATMEVNEDGNLVRTSVDENGETVTETMDLETGEITTSATNEEDVGVASDSTEDGKASSSVESSEQVNEDDTDPIVADGGRQDIDGDDDKSTLFKEDVKEAIESYLDQGADGTFSFREDFLDFMPEDTSYDIIVDALNEVIEERQAPDSEREKADDEKEDNSDEPFVDMLKDLFDHIHENGSQNDILDLIDNIQQGNWEQVGMDMLERAIDNSAFAEYKDILMDLFVPDDPVEASSQDVDMGPTDNFELNIDSGTDVGNFDLIGSEDIANNVPEEVDYSAYDSFTDSVAQDVANEFGNVEGQVDTGYLDGVDTPSDNLSDFSADAADMGVDSSEIASEAGELEEVIEEVIAALL